jgi:hypothetical protein
LAARAAIHASTSSRNQAILFRLMRMRFGNKPLRSNRHRETLEGL